MSQSTGNYPGFDDDAYRRATEHTIGLLMRRGATRQDAEDAVSTASEAILNHLPVDSMEAWLLVAATRALGHSCKQAASRERREARAFAQDPANRRSEGTSPVEEAVVDGDDGTDLLDLLEQAEKLDEPDLARVLRADDSDEADVDTTPLAAPLARLLSAERLVSCGYRGPTLLALLNQVGCLGGRRADYQELLGRLPSWLRKGDAPLKQEDVVEVLFVSACYGAKVPVIPEEVAGDLVRNELAAFGVDPKRAAYQALLLSLLHAGDAAAVVGRVNTNGDPLTVQALAQERSRAIRAAKRRPNPPYWLQHPYLSQRRTVTA